MITSKIDCKAVRAAVNRLRSGPIGLQCNRTLVPDGTARRVIEDEMRAQCVLWAKSWIVNDLLHLLPDNEKPELI